MSLGNQQGLSSQESVGLMKALQEEEDAGGGLALLVKLASEYDRFLDEARALRVADKDDLGLP